MSETVTIELCGRQFPVKSENDQKEVLMRAATFVNDRVRHYEKNYPSSDRQDQLCMALLQLALQFHNQDKAQRENSESLLGQMEQTEQYLSQYLDSIAY